MTVVDIHEIAREGFWLVLLLMAPVLASVALSGVLLAILSRFTRMSDPALSFTARFAAVFAVVLICLPWMSDRVRIFGEHLWQLLQHVVS